MNDDENQEYNMNIENSMNDDEWGEVDRVRREFFMEKETHRECELKQEAERMAHVHAMEETERMEEAERMAHVHAMEEIERMEEAERMAHVHAMEETERMEGAMVTADTYLHKGIESLDKAFGEGYAAKNPALLGAFIQTAAQDYHAALTTKPVDVSCA